MQSLIDEGAFDYGVIKFGGEVGLDVATSMGERTFDSLETQIIEVDGAKLNVVTVQQLYDMKNNSLRQRDMEDAARLREVRGLIFDESIPYDRQAIKIIQRIESKWC